MFRSVQVFRLLPVLLVAMFVSFSACDKDDDDEEKVDYNVTATADGAQEVPAVTTDGTGTVTGTYNKNTNLFTYTVTWKDLTGPNTDMHFHGPAAVGEPAGVALPITGFTPGVMGSHSATATLTEAQEADMLGGKWYYNVHTDLYKAGEIRGQLTVN